MDKCSSVSNQQNLHSLYSSTNSTQETAASSRSEVYLNRAEIAEVSRVDESSRNIVKKLEKDVASAVKKIGDDKKCIENLLNKINSVSNELAESQKQVSELEIQLSKSNEEKKVLVHEVTILSQKNATLESITKVFRRKSSGEKIRINSAAFASQIFTETVTGIPEGLYIDFNSFLPVGTTWDKLADREVMKYSPECIIPNANVDFDESELNTAEAEDIINIDDGPFGYERQDAVDGSKSPIRNRTWSENSNSLENSHSTPFST
jgi:hypothetical protein